MSLNISGVFLESKVTPFLIHFSKTVATTSVLMDGPTGSVANGFPILNEAKVVKMSVYDGVVLSSSSGSVSLSSGDRISVNATYQGNNLFTANFRVNGANSSLQIADLPANTPLVAAVKMLLKED
jgi:hypothetical protein